jgi:adhesin HecA-like repeat protein
LSSAGANLWVQGNQTLQNAAVTLSANGAYVGQIGYGTASAALTLGTQLTMIDSAGHGSQGIRALYSLVNQGTIEVVGISGTVSSESFLVTAETLTNTGSMIATNGTLKVSPTSLYNQGLIEATSTVGATTGGTVILSTAGTITGSGGTLEIGTLGTLQLNSAIDGSQPVTFAGTQATLALTDWTTFGSKIGGLADTDIIDFLDVAYNTMPGSMSASVVGMHTLNLENNGAIVATVTLTGNYSGASFSVAPDSSTDSGTLVTMTGPDAHADGAAQPGFFIDAMAAMGGTGAAIPTAHGTVPMSQRPMHMVSPRPDGPSPLHQLA